MNTRQWTVLGLVLIGLTLIVGVELLFSYKEVAQSFIHHGMTLKVFTAIVLPPVGLILFALAYRFSRAS
ncbi:MAG: hypothetical protein HY093_02360 [Candidatus Liptonbacteria bacterium]|nr:hypothetical protein [Candidatus Liptonbacteria bacterium]